MYFNGKPLNVYEEHINNRYAHCRRYHFDLKPVDYRINMGHTCLMNCIQHTKRIIESEICFKSKKNGFNNYFDLELR